MSIYDMNFMSDFLETYYHLSYKVNETVTITAG